MPTSASAAAAACTSPAALRGAGQCYPGAPGLSCSPPRIDAWGGGRGHQCWQHPPSVPPSHPVLVLHCSCCLLAAEEEPLSDGRAALGPKLGAQTILHVLQLCLHQFLCSRRDSWAGQDGLGPTRASPFSPSLSNCSLLLSREPMSRVSCSGL